MQYSSMQNFLRTCTSRERPIDQHSGSGHGPVWDLHDADRRADQPDSDEKEAIRSSLRPHQSVKVRKSARL